MGFELVLGGIIKLLGSAGFGSLFGGIMGIFNRKADLAQKRLELEHERERWTADQELMRLEAQGKLAVAQTEAQAKVEAAGYEAMTASYSYAKPAAGGKMEAFASFVRPFVTLGYYLLTATLTLWVYWQAFADGFVLSIDKKAELMFLVTDWNLMMAGAVIGWWFAMRPGKGSK
jgi:hypothetical protein